MVSSFSRNGFKQRRNIIFIFNQSAKSCPLFTANLQILRDYFQDCEKPPDSTSCTLFVFKCTKDNSCLFCIFSPPRSVFSNQQLFTMRCKAALFYISVSHQLIKVTRYLMRGNQSVNQNANQTRRECGTGEHFFLFFLLVAWGVRVCVRAISYGNGFKEISLSALIRTLTRQIEFSSSCDLHP